MQRLSWLVVIVFITTTVILVSELNRPGVIPRANPKQVQFLSCSSRLVWLQKRLSSSTLQQIVKAAETEKIDPVKLLVVIANELSDYGVLDQLQERFNIGTSFGIGQMTIKTIIRHSLLLAGDIQHPDFEVYLNTGLISLSLKRTIVNNLRYPAFTSTLVAREINYIQQKMTASVGTSHTYANNFLKRSNRGILPIRPLPLSLVDPRDPKPNLETRKQVSIDFAIVGAYQSDSILDTQEPLGNIYDIAGRTFNSARIHAFNSFPWSLCLRSQTGAHWIKEINSS